ncbi:DsbA family protein [Lentibacillus amyloliquefaciens]|uniref:Dithiol-disulfide isomerase n=1 Tax=Lentibacillus amyloliquefaciens TaxID=1472767 RepID=A0A0U4DVB7_9BACI|nr:DsbA family protein [Lentibacillus amyloliquefaciens]ALX49320.1 dithiol-disulfide isomerase [Lentibacillus amyloliquefaciens]
MENQNNMVCNPETGVCGPAGEDDIQMIDFNKPPKTIDLYYVTDPICSHCWALEPVLNRFTEQYGDYFNIHTVMGGLLEKWGDGPVDPANGISGPADVAGHWQEVGEQTRMPIDGTLWYDNPVHSSYPPSRAFKVIQKQDEGLANVFLRHLREAVFAFNQNIADKEVLVPIINKLGLDGEKIFEEAESERGQQLLNEDFALAASLGARGFPTIILVNEENKGVKIVGGRPLEFYVSGLKQVLDTDEPESQPQPALSNLLKKNKLLFSKEIEIMYDLDKSDVAAFVEKELESGTYDENEILGEKYFTQQ